jgi:hypothetical protein
MKPFLRSVQAKNYLAKVMAGDVGSVLSVVAMLLALLVARAKGHKASHVAAGHEHVVGVDGERVHDGRVAREVRDERAVALGERERKVVAGDAGEGGDERSGGGQLRGHGGGHQGRQRAVLGDERLRVGGGQRVGSRVRGEHARRHDGRGGGGRSLGEGGVGL